MYISKNCVQYFVHLFSKCIPNIHRFFYFSNLFL